MSKERAYQTALQMHLRRYTEYRTPKVEEIAKAAGIDRRTLSWWKHRPDWIEVDKAACMAMRERFDREMRAKWDAELSQIFLKPARKRPDIPLPDSLLRGECPKMQQNVTGSGASSRVCASWGVETEKERDDLRTMRELIRDCPRIVPVFARWSGGRLVAESVYRRLRDLALSGDGRTFYAEGPYLSCWFLWIGEPLKEHRPLCGATTRKGSPCGYQVVEGRTRCNLHGGASTGPKTAEGRACIAESNRRRAEQRKKDKVKDSTDQPVFFGKVREKFPISDGF